MTERGHEFAEFGSAAEQQAWEYRALALRRLDWSIRALHGRAGRLAEVHQSFITDELLDIDHRPATWRMPKGVGTINLAAKLMMASGGEMEINGRTAAGHDIRWRPLTGGYALVERKDRAYEIGAAEPLDRRMRYVVSKIREAGNAFPSEPEAGRVLAVGLPGFVSADEQDLVRTEMESALHAAFAGQSRPDRFPDFLIIEMVGASDAGGVRFEMNDFFFVIDLDLRRPEWEAVRPAFLRAFTRVGRNLYPDPWPIEF
jgi:hypothetical protein